MLIQAFFFSPPANFPKRDDWLPLGGAPALSDALIVTRMKIVSNGLIVLSNPADGFRSMKKYLNDFLYAVKSMLTIAEKNVNLS